MSLQLQLHTSVQSRARRFDLAIDWRTAARSIVIHGPSGAGKSLTLQAVAGLLKPARGRIVLADRVLFDSASGQHLPARARGIGYVFQDYALFPHLDVRQNIAFGLRGGWRNPPRSLRDPGVEHWLDTLGLREVASQPVQSLSGGQRQRTALARALAGTPRALLLDEPFSALDLPLRQHLREELRRLVNRLQIPLLMISHDVDDLHCFGEAQLALQDGRALANPDSTRPATATTTALSGPGPAEDRVPDRTAPA